jgi:hypothetical protein
MYIGTVVRNQVPMLITDNEEHVEFVCEHLAAAMEQAYTIYAFFHDEEYTDDD